jgi:hypothetical protein
MTNEDAEAKLPELGPGGGDRTAAVARVMISGIAAGIPLIGPLIGQTLFEVVSELIPNQRIDRLENYMRMLGEEIALLKIPNVDEAIKRPENIDLFEDGVYQAVRALTDKRKRLIAKAVAKGIASEEQSKMREKRILKILDDLDDQEVLILEAYGSDFVSARLQEIRPPLASDADPVEKKERSWFFDWAVERLLRLNLLRNDGKFITVTAIGKSVLKAVDLLPPGKS